MDTKSSPPSSSIGGTTSEWGSSRWGRVAHRLDSLRGVLRSIEIVSLATPVSSRIAVMRPFCTIAVSVALLASFLEAPYFHVHGNRASDHARDHHLAQAQRPHTHLSVASHHSVHNPDVELSAAGGEDGALFLAWTPGQPHGVSSFTFSPRETTVVVLPGQVADFQVFEVWHSHDPPLVFPSAPRSPPV